MSRNIIVNYYPCSFGDTLVKMLLGVDVDSSSIIQDTGHSVLKLPQTYQSQINKDMLTALFEIQPVLPAHRQNGFDYTTVMSDVMVISIWHDVIAQLVDRVKAVHIDLLGYKFFDQRVQMLIDRNPDLLDRAIEVDYDRWADSNILATSDIVLPFSYLCNPIQMQRFCRDHNLNYNVDCINFIANA
jgi:hypothetical protein